MAVNVYLGISESGAYTLPTIRGRGGLPRAPISLPKQVEKSIQLDGSTRYNFKSVHPRKWLFEYDVLTYAQLDELLLIYSYNEGLVMQNNWEDATWRDVIISNFDYEPNIDVSQTGDIRYRVSITIEEIV